MMKAICRETSSTVHATSKVKPVIYIIFGKMQESKSIQEIDFQFGQMCAVLLSKGLNSQFNRIIERNYDQSSSVDISDGEDLKKAAIYRKILLQFFTEL